MKKNIMVILMLITSIPLVSAVVYQNIAVETGNFVLCYNNLSNCGSSFNKTAKEDGLIYIRNAEFDLRVDAVDKFQILIEDIFFPILLFLILGGIIYGFFYYPHKSLFG